MSTHYRRLGLRSSVEGYRTNWWDISPAGEILRAEFFGVQGLSGSLVAQEGGFDTFTATGAVRVSGTFTAVEGGSDIFAASGTVAGAGITGTLAAQEGGSDGMSARGNAAAVRHQANGTAITGTTVGPTVAWPAHQTDDIGILVVESSGATGGPPTPSGWEHVPGSPVVDVANNTGSTLSVFWRRATSNAEASVTLTASGDHDICVITTFRGVDPRGVPFNVTATGTKTTASTTLTFPAVTTTEPNCQVVGVVGRPNDAAGNTHFGNYNPANLVDAAERGEVGNAGGDGGGFAVVSGLKGAPGDSGQVTGTKTVSTTDTYVIFALRPTAQRLVVQEAGSDTLTASGTVGNNAITGTLAAVESATKDTITATGAVRVSGTFAAAESATKDTFASTGAVRVSGTFAAVESATKDTFASTGAVRVSGTFAAVESATKDTFSATGAVRVVGSLIAQEQPDTLSAAGRVLVRGTMTAAENAAKDIFSATGVVRVAGSLAAQESATDTLTTSGRVLVRGTLVAQEQPDTFSATGSVLVRGTFAAAENATKDFFAAVGGSRLQGSLSVQEAGSDIIVSSGRVLVRGSLATQEQPDTFSATGRVLVRGSLSAQEPSSDIIVSSGRVLVRGALSSQEQGDTASVSGRVLVRGTVTAVESGKDALTADGIVTVGGVAGTMSASEGIVLSQRDALLIFRLAQVHGLIPGQPLVVTPTSRQSGDLLQTISDSAGVVTITPTELPDTPVGSLSDWIDSLSKVHGLVESTPLVVSPTSRVAGDLNQTITEAGVSVSVERV